MFIASTQLSSTESNARKASDQLGMTKPTYAHSDMQDEA